MLGDNAGCEWDSIDDRAAGIDAVCEGGVYASTCSPTCALAKRSPNATAASRDVGACALGRFAADDVR